MMNSFIQLANSCLPDDTIRAQFEFAKDGVRVYGIAAGKGVWYTIDDCNLSVEKTLFPVPYGDLEDTEGIIYKEYDTYYPYDEFKCSRVTTERLSDWIGLYEDRQFVTISKLPTHILVLDSKCYSLGENIEPSDLKIWNAALPLAAECACVIDLDKTLGKLLGQINKRSIKGYAVHVQKNRAPMVHVKHTKGYAAISAALLPACNINGYEVVSDNIGILTEKGKQIMRERLGNLKSFNTEVSEPTVEQVVQDINTAETLRATAVKVVPLEVTENKVPTLELIPVIPVDIPKPPTPVELPKAEEPVQKVQETVTFPTTPEVAVEATTEAVKEDTAEEPMSIDKLRYEFTEIKAKISAFDKDLREYAKVGACNKKTQAELDKLKNENLKLKEEIKRLIKDSEQLTKLKKLMATIND